MIVTERLIAESVDSLFAYAMVYITNEGVPSPKLHMIDQIGRTTTISCDSWGESRNYEALGSKLDEFAESFNAVLCLLVFVGEIDETEIVGILSYRNPAPKLHYKPIIWRAGLVDFGPAVVLPWNRVKNLQF